MSVQGVSSAGARIALRVSLLVALVLFGVPATYVPALRIGLSAALLVAIGLAAWKAGASDLLSPSDSRRRIALSGMLLIAPFALLSLVPGFGPPEFADHVQNQQRYVVLLVSALAVSFGLLLLRDALGDNKDETSSRMGASAVTLAAPLYSVFVAIQLVLHRFAESAGAGPDQPSLQVLNELSVVLLYFGAVLFYLSTMGFAFALGRIGRISKTKARVLAGVCTIAILSLLVAKIVSAQWFELPLFLFAIPAVPWIMPCLLGLDVLGSTAE